MREDKTGTGMGYQSCRGGKKIDKFLGGNIVIECGGKEETGAT